MNTPIKMYGGKGNMFNEIIKHFPPDIDYDMYVEPYGGSYSIGLKLDPIPKMEIYNDLDKNIYSLYKVISDVELFAQFKEKCDLIFYNEDLRNEFKGLLKTDNLSLIDRAFYFFYVNRTSFNGTGGFSMNTHVRRGMSKSISDYLSAIDRLPELHDRLSRVMVSNMDGVKLIDRFSSPRTLIYCDPPYHPSTRTGARYKVDMNHDGHIDFIKSVTESKSKIIISGYDCELYDSLTDNGFKKISFEVNTTGNDFKAKSKIETLWINY